MVKPQTQAHWLSQCSLELMQLYDRGLDSTEYDVAVLEINHHCYQAALQGSRDNSFSFIMVGKQLAFAIVRKAPGLCVVSKGAAVLPLPLDALIGHGDVPVSLSLHHPDVGTSGEARGGEDLRGFIEAAVTVGIVQLSFHSLYCLEVSRDSKERTGCVRIQHGNS